MKYVYNPSAEMMHNAMLAMVLDTFPPDMPVFLGNVWK